MDWISPNIALGDNIDGLEPAGCDVLLNAAAEHIAGHDLDHLHLKIGNRGRFLTGNSIDRSGVFRGNAWTDKRVLVRRIAGVSRSSPG